MLERELADKNKILEIVTGSYLYGTAVPGVSDKDYVGVFLPDVEHILGFKTVEEVDFSIVDKDLAGKNTQNAQDRKLYEFRKFIKLAMENNPNVLEQVFVNPDNTVFINDVGKQLLANRHLFPHKGLKQKFLGYAFAQKHKMIIKKDNYFDFIQASDYLQKQEYGKTLLEIVLDPKCPHFIKRQNDYRGNISFVQIGDLNLMPNCIVKKAKTIVAERLDKVGNREELLTKYGFDTKFASHLIRLMLEGIELLKTGELQFPLKEAEMLKDIRNGKWQIQKIFDYSYELEKEIESIAENSIVPDGPNYDELEKFSIKTLRKII
jgi:hypothetical protein